MADTMTAEQRLFMARLELRRAKETLGFTPGHRNAMARTQVEAALDDVERALAFLQAAQSSPAFIPPVDPRKV